MMQDYLPLHYQQMHELAKIVETLKTVDLIMTQLADLTAAVTAQNTVIASTVALLDGLVARLQAAAVSIANGDGGADLTTVIHSIQTNTAALSAAVVKDTAAAGEIHETPVAEVPAASTVAPEVPVPAVPEAAPVALETPVAEAPASTVAATLPASDLDAHQ